METEDRNPLALLVELDRRYRAANVGLPMQSEMREYWRGVGFVLAGAAMLAPLDAVEEILTVPAMTRVPLTKPWVLGLANVRGNLLPVMDLQGFLTGTPAVIDADSRVLALRDDEFATGVLVDRVTGLQQIDTEFRLASVDGVGEAFAALVDGGFRVDGSAWPLVDFGRLAARAEFMQAAA